MCHLFLRLSDLGVLLSVDDMQAKISQLEHSVESLTVSAAAMLDLDAGRHESAHYNVAPAG